MFLFFNFNLGGGCKTDFAVAFFRPGRCALAGNSVMCNLRNVLLCFGSETTGMFVHLGCALSTRIWQICICNKKKICIKSVGKAQLGAGGIKRQTSKYTLMCLGFYQLDSMEQAELG